MSESKPVRDPVPILYMEDDAGLAELVQRRLARRGFAAEIAPDGESGLEMGRGRGVATGFEVQESQGAVGIARVDALSMVAQ